MKETAVRDTIEACMMRMTPTRTGNVKTVSPDASIGVSGGARTSKESIGFQPAAGSSRRRLWVRRTSSQYCEDSHAANTKSLVYMPKTKHMQQRTYEHGEARAFRRPVEPERGLPCVSYLSVRSCVRCKSCLSPLRQISRSASRWSLLPPCSRRSKARVCAGRGKRTRRSVSTPHSYS